jgi:hypothetical protein
MQDSRDLVSILYDVNEQLRVLRQASAGVTKESPLEAMARLGELARELETFRTVRDEAVTA